MVSRSRDIKNMVMSVKLLDFNFYREQLLVVLLHVTSKVLDTKQSHFGVKNPDSLGSKLASALFQTLIVR